jgi:hypothetical protein
MKNILITCLIALNGFLTFAQKIALNGNVTDSNNRPVAYAFVKDAVKNYATFSDAFGNFTLNVDAADRLLVSAVTYKSITVKVTDPNNVRVALISDGTKDTKINDPETFQDRLSNEGMTKNSATGYIAHENTLHGSNYLFDHWVHGYAITSDDSIKQDNNYLFNYHKTDGTLLITSDGKKMEEIARPLVKAFYLFDDQGNYIFENVAAIDTKHYVQVLSAGSNYKIYKQLGTKFFPNDYVSNGMTSTGHNYDEIKDEPVYFVKVGSNAPQQFNLKSRSIKAAFAADAAKVSKYLADHDGDIDDAYLKDLGDYLNN